MGTRVERSAAGPRRATGPGRVVLATLREGPLEVPLAATGWRLSVEELVAARMTSHLAGPPETARLRASQDRPRRGTPFARAAAAGPAPRRCGRGRKGLLSSASGW